MFKSVTLIGIASYQVKLDRYIVEIIDRNNRDDEQTDRAVE